MLTTLRTRPIAATITATLLVATLALLAAVAAGPAGLLPGGDDRATAQRATSDIWRVGTRWTVTTTQNGAAIAGDKTGAVYSTTYRFRVEEAPATSKGDWIVRVTAEGAEGLFADGWRLYYRADSGSSFALRAISLGDREPLGVEHAAIMLGQEFPLDLRVDAAPRSRSVKLDLAGNNRNAAVPPPSGVVPATNGLPEAELPR